MVENGLSLGMLSTSSMELRHLVFGRPAHRGAMRGGGGGRRFTVNSETGKAAPAVSRISKIAKNQVRVNHNV